MSCSQCEIAGFFCRWTLMILAAGTVLLASLGGLETITQIRDNLGVDPAVPDFLSRPGRKIVFSGYAGLNLPVSTPLLVLGSPNRAQPLMMRTIPSRVIAVGRCPPPGTYHITLHGILYSPAAFRKYDVDLLSVAPDVELFLIDSRVALDLAPAEKRILDDCVRRIRMAKGPGRKKTLAFLYFGGGADLHAARSELRRKYRDVPVAYFPFHTGQPISAIVRAQRAVGDKYEPRLHFVTAEKKLAFAAARYRRLVVHLISPDATTTAGKARPIMHKSLAAFREYLAHF